MAVEQFGWNTSGFFLPVFTTIEEATRKRKHYFNLTFHHFYYVAAGVVVVFVTGRSSRDSSTVVVVARDEHRTKTYNLKCAYIYKNNKILYHYKIKNE